MKLKFILHILLLTLCLSSFAAIIPTFEIQKSPAWKTIIPFETQGKDFHTSGDMSYILIDWQYNKLLHESNYRYVLRLNNAEGVQNYSQVSFTFEPSYQKLVINKINIHRGSQLINHLKRSDIELMRNEENSDRLIYDGSYNAITILKDVRAGDVIEYEYTLKGENPVFSDYTHLFVRQSFRHEVLHNYRRLIVPASEELIVKTIQGGEKPVVTITGNTKSLVWDLGSRPVIYEDANIPTWYKALPACEISSFKDWGEVIKWGIKLFPYDLITPKLDAFMRDRKFDNSEQGIIGVIRFVQDEVRYLGIEIGTHSQRPHHPEEVFNNRFGDCKDKSYLLTVMLRKLGVEAWPAYAHTTNKKSIDENAPSPFAFNHAIVKFRRNSIDYWVDPTINLQRGNLALLCLPNYQRALVLDKNSKGLEEIPVSKLDKVIMHEDMWFADSTSEIKYEVESVYMGNLANTLRSRHLSSSISEIRESYLNFCSDYYSNIKWTNDSALQTTDYPETNSFKVRESYIVRDLWKHTATDSVDLYATFPLYNIYEYLSSSKDRLRKMPLAIYFPINVDHSVVFHFPEHKEIRFSPSIDSVVNNTIVLYRKTSVDQKMHTYTINYTYRTNTDFVPVDQQKAYFKDYDRLYNLCGEYINWGMATQSTNTISWPSIIVSLLFIRLMAWILSFVYRSDFGLKGTGKNPMNFGGWLIFPIIGLCFTPLLFVAKLYKLNYFGQNLWTSFIAKGGSHPFLMGSFYYFELLFNVSIILVSAFLIVLLVQKRITFPKIHVWFCIIVLGGMILDAGLSFLFMDTAINKAELMMEIIGVGIWVPYILMSGRVRKTFVNTFEKPKPEVAWAPE